MLISRLLALVVLAGLSAAQANAATFESLTETAHRDLSERKRLAAAIAALGFEGGKTLAFADSFVKSEPGLEVRREFLLALATAPALADNPDATRLLAASLAVDPSPEVRRAVAAALAARGDKIGLGAARRAAREDADKNVRQAAARAVAILDAPLKPKPLAKGPAAPNENAIIGRDPCRSLWGWCECSGAIRAPAKCMIIDDCRDLQSQVRHSDLTCLWNGQSLRPGQ